MNWWEVGEGATYLPALNATEAKYSIPHNLLARIAFQESHFRADIINDAVVSPAGALGIMQLEPQFFPDAGESPIADIATAGNFLESLYQRFKDWQIALAAYNWGPGNVDKCIKAGGTLASMPIETQNYVTQICADVPVSGSLLTGKNS